MNYGIFWAVIFFVFVLPTLALADEPADTAGLDGPTIEWQVDEELVERASALYQLREMEAARPESLEPPVPEGMEIEFVALDDLDW